MAKDTSKVTLTRWQRSRSGNTYRKDIDMFVCVYKCDGGYRYMVKIKWQEPVYSTLYGTEGEASQAADDVLDEAKKIADDAA
jgi:hypothetical protein